MRWLTLLIPLLLPLPATAEMPLPSYKKHLGIQAWFEVNAKIDQASQILAQHDSASGRNARADSLLREAIQYARAYELEVAESSGLAYLQGLAWRLLRDDSKAEAAYRRSIALDDQAADAWHDLGEMMIAQARWKDANDAFAHVARIVDSGKQAWRGPLRQAEIAAHQHNAVAFEEHMREALRRGYRMAWTKEEPQWRIFFHDPVLHDTVNRLMRFYGSRELAAEFQANPP